MRFHLTQTLGIWKSGNLTIRIQELHDAKSSDSYIDTIILQIDARKSSITNLESQVDDLKKRSSNQLDEINRLEDQVRNMNIDQTAMQSKIDNLQLNVS